VVIPVCVLARRNRAFFNVVAMVGGTGFGAGPTAIGTATEGG
jgi:hypothetical protein